MVKKLQLFSLLFFISCSLFAQPESDVIVYIGNYKNIAIEEQLRSGIPAAITLAQAIHESAAGKSELSVKANNHFGIKCKTNWTGETILHDDDKKQECFRKYINAQQSYIDHSDFLKTGSRYQSLFDIEVTDYVNWATGLKKAGYATNPSYVRKLTDLVERYNLQQYTYEALSRAKKPGEVVPDTDRNPDIVEDPSGNYKGLKGYWAKQGELISDRAAQFNLRPAKLLEWNDLEEGPLYADMFIFTERKRKMGTVEFHVVREGENMHIISQKEAMWLQNLYHFNNLKPGEEPEPGEQLALQYRSYGKPRIKGKVPEAVITESKVPVQNIPEPEVNNPAPVAATPTDLSSPDILDPEKAKKVEQVLGNPPEPQKLPVTPTQTAKPTPASASAGTAKTKTVPVKTKPASPELPAVEAMPGQALQSEAPAVVAETPKAEAPKPEKKPVALAPKRTYNEPGVSDSVKALKERFDALVYRPMPERKAAPEVKTVNPEVKKQEAIKKTAAAPPKDSVAKKKAAPAKPATPVKPAEKPKEPVAKNDRNPGVEKTRTGLVRDVQKLEEEKKKQKEAQAKQAGTKTAGVKNAATPVKGKAGAPPKKEDASKAKSDPKKKTPAKNEKQETAVKKKADPKKPVKK